MVSGSDEHGTPITVTAETQNIEPQQVVDEFHKTNRDALIALGCAGAIHRSSRSRIRRSLVQQNIGPRHKRMVQENFSALETAGFFERKTMEQYYEVHPDGGGRFLQTAMLRHVLLAAATVLVRPMRRMRCDLRSG